jgi:hypothetical protein
MVAVPDMVGVAVVEIAGELVVEGGLHISMSLALEQKLMQSA